MSFSTSLKKIPYISLVSQIARRRKLDIWLVGGFLRDGYLKKNKDLLDFDFCVEKDTIPVVKEFAKKISSKFIMLDKSNESLRVILKRKNKVYNYDFTLMRGENLHEDLFLRDFSINTLAVDLRDKKLQLIDNFKARRDLKGKLIRVINERVLQDDPLRILRAFSFFANYGFRIEKNTSKLMFKYRKLIKRTSGERINEELFKILSCSYSFKAIKLMDSLKIIEELIPYVDKMRSVPQGAYHHHNVWSHSIEALRQFELFYKKKLAKNKEFVPYLNKELANGRRRIHIIKLACILHDTGKPFAKRIEKNKTIFHTHEKIGVELSEKIANDLRLSFREKDLLKKLIFWHLRPGYLADQVEPSRRAIYRFFRDTQNEGPAVVFLSLADWRATRGPLTDAKKRKRHEKVMLKLVESYFLEKKKKPLPKIVDGYDLMKKFKLKSSPLIGDILKKIKEEQALGKVRNKREAYKLAKKLISKANK